MQRSRLTQLNSHLRPAQLAPSRAPVRRCASSWTRQNRRSTEDDDGDFRPPWVYSGSRFLTYTTIPVTLLYCAFIADWGEREHIFMPLRRWALKYKQSIFSLSPEEAALVQGNKGQPPSNSTLPAERNYSGP